MKALVVFLLAVLGCSLQAQGIILSKCDLRDRLDAAVAKLPLVKGHMARSDKELVANFVCLAEKLTGFNTGAVNEVSDGKLDRGHRGQDAPGPSHKGENKTYIPSALLSRMCYGVFQLSNRLSCNDSVNSTYNICGASCSQFKDDDITDDIDCLLTFFRHHSTKDHAPPPAYLILSRLHVIFPSECDEADYDAYFVDCPPPQLPN